MGVTASVDWSQDGCVSGYHVNYSVGTVRWIRGKHVMMGIRTMGIDVRINVRRRLDLCVMLGSYLQCVLLKLMMISQAI